MIPQILDSSTCLSCRGCCRFSAKASVWSPVLLNEEIASGAIPSTVIGADKRIRLISDTLERCFICPLLNVHDDTCTVYEKRPFECRLYPFVLTKTGVAVWLAADPQCPFVEQHAHEPDFRDYTAMLTAFFATDPGLTLLKDNGHLIQEYSGVIMLAEVTPQPVSRIP
jgi:Fe-S-cluster containining protein